MKLLAFTALILISNYSWACRCMDFSPHNTDEKLYFSEKVYLGSIISAQLIGDGSRSSASLKVKEIFKGDVFDIEEVTSRNTSCGVRLVLNTTYLVFEDNLGHVNLCTMQGDTLYNGVYIKKEIEYLKSLQK